MSQRALAKESRRRRILDAARLIIARDGSFSVLSTGKVAEEAGASVPTLYNLFGSKEAIRLALVADLIDWVDAEGLRDQALYGLDLCVLAVASEALRPRLVAAIRKVGRQMRRRSKRAA